MLRFPFPPPWSVVWSAIWHFLALTGTLWSKIRAHPQRLPRAVDRPVEPERSRRIAGIVIAPRPKPSKVSDIFAKSSFKNAFVRQMFLKTSPNEGTFIVSPPELIYRTPTCARNRNSVCSFLHRPYSDLRLLLGERTQKSRRDEPRRLEGNKSLGFSLSPRSGAPCPRSLWRSPPAPSSCPPRQTGIHGPSAPATR